MYTTEIVLMSDATMEIEDFIVKALTEINDSRDKFYNNVSFDLKKYLENYHCFTCRKNGKLVGFILAMKGPSAFSNQTNILISDVLYAVPGTRAAHHLIHSFLDIGKGCADHVIIALNVKSNIKPKTLERLGLKETEKLFIWRKENVRS